MPTNLLSSPSFETGNGGWDERANAIVAVVTSADALDGTKVLRAKARAAGNMDVHNDAGGRIAFPENTQFVYSVRVRPVGSVARTCIVFLDYINQAQNGVIGNRSGVEISAPAGQWTTIFLTGTSPAGTGYMRNSLRFNSVAVNEEWDVDCAAVYTNTTDPAYQGPYTAAPVAPVANAGLDQEVDATDVVTLQGGGTDSDGTIANYQWRQVSGPDVTLSSTTSASPTFTAKAGNYEFGLIVTDNSGMQSAEDFVSVTALAGHPVLVMRNGIEMIGRRYFYRNGVDLTPAEDAPTTITNLTATLLDSSEPTEEP